MFTYIKESVAENGSTGRLVLNGNSYSAVSGPFQNGDLPDGTYHVRTRHVTDSPTLASSFQAGGASFFIPIEHEEDTSRNGLGIHPNGNNPEGTEGCVGIAGEDAGRFWEAWMGLSLADRPTTLEVVRE